MMQEQSVLQPVSELSSLFPDIEQQLCSKHSILFGKLKHTFNKLYDGFEPTNYIVVKGIAQIMNNNEISLEMALENGVIVLVSKTYQHANTYINGNHIDEELILDPSGSTLEGLHEWQQDLSQLFKAVTKDIPEQQRFGGIFYVHANIPQGMFQYKKSLLISMFLGVMTINSTLANHTVDSLIRIMSSVGIASEEELQKYFYDYENRRFSLNVGLNHFQLPLNPDLKLLFCRLDLASLDMQHHIRSQKRLAEKKSQIVGCLRKKFGISSIYQAFQEEISVNKSELPGEQQEAEDIIQLEMKEIENVCQFSNKEITIQQLLSLKWEVDSQLKNMYTPEVIELVESIRDSTGCQECAIVEGEFLVMATARHKFPELICLLRQLLHRGELKSKSCFKIMEEGLVQNRWKEDLQIGEKIFACAPSKGVAIFDPSSAIWFD